MMILYDELSTDELISRYDSLIADGFSDKPVDTVYYERHHIIPKSLGGTNDSANLVYLTGSNHFEAHRLLFHIHGKSGPMAQAFWYMSNMGDWEYTPEEYAVAREVVSNYMSSLFDDPDFMANHINRLKARYSDPAVIEVCAARQRMQNADPEYQDQKTQWINKKLITILNFVPNIMI